MQKEGRLGQGTVKGPKWIRGAYVHTDGPLDPGDAAFIRDVVKDAAREWAKKEEPSEKDDSEG